LEKVYDSTKVGIPAVSELVELWRYRDLLKFMVINSIKTRYKRSVLGVVWTLLNPLLNTLVLSIALSAIMRFQVDNYPIYLLVGLIFWNFFSQTTVTATHTLIWGSGLLKRVYIPRTIFAVSVLGNGLINILLSLIPLTLIMLAMQHPIQSVLVFLPLPVLLLAMFTLGVALLVSTLAILFVDIVDMYSVILSAWFFLTPIIYPLSIVPENIRIYIQWNPMNVMVGMFRSLLYYGEMPSLTTLGTAGIIAITTLVIGWIVFSYKVDELAYRI
jgi:ABC-type polysaccharide/polyol phosphate export permease